ASIGFFELPSRQPLARKPDGNDVIPDTQILKNLREHGPPSDGQWHLAMRRYDESDVTTFTRRRCRQSAVPNVKDFIRRGPLAKACRCPFAAWRSTTDKIQLN